LKLLFDANLSPKLVARLSGLFPGSAHVFETGLARDTSDETICECAAANGFSVVTADSDFLEIARRHGPALKVIRIENCRYRTSRVEMILRRHAILIAEFETSGEAVLVVPSLT
jgi:predicted nuclease of predicted toxin-antitoxin system